MSYNSDNEIDDSYEDDLINEFGDKDEDESLSELDSNLRPKEERLGMQAKEEEYIYDDKKSSKKKKTKKFKKIEKNNKVLKTVYIIGFIIIFSCIFIDAIAIGYKVLKQEKNDVKDLLLYTDKAVVYENISIKKKTHDRIPAININNSSIADINNDINNTYNDYINNNPDYFRYEYSINKDTISLLLIYRNRLETENKYSYKFKTYNVSLKTLTALSNEQILDKYRLKTSDVYEKMRKSFRTTYEDLLSKNYIKETYTYNKLIIDLELSDFTNGINYYIDDNKLYVYRSFNIYNNPAITSYFNEDNYRFYIK